MICDVFLERGECGRCGSWSGVKYLAPTLVARDPAAGCGGVISSSNSISPSVVVGMSTSLNKVAASRSTVLNGYLTGVGVVSGVTVAVLWERLLRGATVYHTSLLLMISLSLLLLLIYVAAYAACVDVVRWQEV